MIIFEDKSDDLLSLLFKKSYNKDISDKFLYCEGNGSITQNVEKSLIETSERVIVFLDTVPENKSIEDIYGNLLKLSIKYPMRLFVMNIVCAEYYFIKSICNSNVIKNKSGLDIILNRGLYHMSSLIETAEDKKFVKNFEKFCKLFLIKNVRNCAKHTRGHGDNINLEYGFYYTKDCDCLSTCDKVYLTSKSEQLLYEYPCIPAESNITEVVEMSDERIVQLHRKLIDDYNDMVLKYNESNTARKSKLLKYMY